ncbi:MAG TPA: hypothetical protein VK213_00730 [Bacteroidales bacterium]|nr:hypothetical protein [Bacteroidales bacterium]
MEYFTAQKIKEEWGSKNCDHPEIERLYYSGAFLISYVCIRCGKEFTISQKMELAQKRKHSYK